MDKILHDIVRFRGDKLFNGAVNIDWFSSDAKKASDAAKAFVFHGPEYHGVSQSDVGIEHGHQLQDTASFAKSILRRCYGLEEQAFTLAIAGYGTGKSHFGLTIANLLSNPNSPDADAVLRRLEQADKSIGSTTRELIDEVNHPCLVIALNGMKSFDLASEVSRQIIQQVKKQGYDTQALDELRPRFAQATSLVEMAEGNQDFVQEILEACDVDSIKDVLERLEKQDDETYRRLYQIFESRNIKITALGGESVRDVIEVATREYCGVGKPFRSIAILFDEFGRYIEFATIKSHVAGSGVLQDLFEAVQSNSSKASFVGFIQFELNAYMQRVAPEHKNEMLRYVTRYQTANKVYLSINLETLIANLIEKQDPEFVSRIYDNEVSQQQSEAIVKNITNWFPVSNNHRIWTDSESFHKVIRKGCWPLSPYAVWLLYYLAAAGKHLQERSVLALLNETLSRYRNQPFDESDHFILSPTDLWSEALQQELITSEESGQQGAITHAFNTVHARHGAQISPVQNSVLKAIVLASKLALKASSQSDAIQALAALSGVGYDQTQAAIQTMREELNIIEWDESFKQFDILGDAVPRTQFLSFLRQRVANTYNEAARGSLFASKAADCCEHLCNIDTDFAEKKRITTKEWFFEATVSNLENLSLQLKACVDNWHEALEVDQPRGNVFYCYVEPSRDIESTEREVSKLIKYHLMQAGRSEQPILVVMLYDADGALGQSLAELAVLEEDLNAQDTARFGNLINAHKEKIREDIRTRIMGLLKERRYVTPFRDNFESKRLSSIASAIFERTYKKPLTFPFDGFSTARGNAATTCQTLTRELLHGRLDWNAVMSKPAKEQNRATTVLRDAWGIFDKGGTVMNRPKNMVVKKIAELWDEQLNGGKQMIPLYDAMKQLCAPPYGANIASAGLFLGVYVAARNEKLSIAKSDSLMSVAEWLQEGFFKGKFIDIKRFHNVSLISTGESSSEWEILLEEWEQAESYRANIEFRIKADELEKKTPLPPQQAYKVQYLKKSAEDALKMLKKNDDIQNNAITRIENGLERENIGLAIHGGSELAKLLNQMQSDESKWERQEIEKLEGYVQNVGQSVIHHFYDWLKQQQPSNGTPEAVGDFKHKMLQKIGNGLSQLNLPDLKDALEKHTNKVVREIEAITETRRFVQEVRAWLDGHTEALELVRVAELRSLRATGKDYATKLKRMYKRLEIKDINDVLLQLVNRLDEIGQALDGAKQRASALWDTEIHTLDEAERLQTEVETLFSIYDGCPVDLDDLQVMRRCLRLFIQAHKQLNDEQLTEDKFENLASRLADEIEQTITDEEQPWDTYATIMNFKSEIAEQREQKSQNWIDSVSADIEQLDTLKTSEINSLYTRAIHPPAILTNEHNEQLSEIKQIIEQRLNIIKIEWLIEKYKELSPEMQQKFISRIM